MCETLSCDYLCNTVCLHLRETDTLASEVLQITFPVLGFPPWSGVCASSLQRRPLLHTGWRRNVWEQSDLQGGRSYVTDGMAVTLTGQYSHART